MEARTEGKGSGFLLCFWGKRNLKAVLPHPREIDTENGIFCRTAGLDEREDYYSRCKKPYVI
jgi:hypothetical protein